MTPEETKAHRRENTQRRREHLARVRAACDARFEARIEARAPEWEARIAKMREAKEGPMAKFRDVPVSMVKYVELD